MTWKILDDHLTKEFTFTNYTKAVEFVTKILPLANKADHHPDILIHSYKKVKIILITHSQNKITSKDHSLAKQIDLLPNSK